MRNDLRIVNYTLWVISAGTLFPVLASVNLDGITNGDHQMLIGPVLYIRTKTGCWVPDYSRPNVAERIAAEVDLVTGIEWRRGG